MTPIELARAVLRRAPLLRRGALAVLARVPALRLAVHRRLAASADADYRVWILSHEMREVAGLAELPPVPISVIMPVFNPTAQNLRAAIESVRAQTWPHWQLCIADDASTAPHVARVLAAFSADARIRIERRSRNGHISAASNSALALATGDFVALLDHDDVLAPHALARVAQEIAAHPDAALLYSDEDQLDRHGRRCQPAFKPDFDFSLLRSRNFISHLGVYRRDRLLQLGGFREGFEGSQDHDLALRVAEAVAPEKIRHIPAVLYHWRQDSAQNFSARALARCADASLRAVAEHLERTGTDAQAVAHPLVPAAVRVLRAPPAPAPLVSVIVPARDRADFLARCADGVLHHTDYPALEFLVVDNNSVEPATAALLTELARDARVRVLRNREKFNFSALCNQAAAAAHGKIIVLLNNDIEVIEAGWLRELVVQAVRPEIGAVGAKLLYPDGRIQHAGIVLGVGPDRVAAHMCAGAARDADGPGAALLLERQVGAVTAACLAVRRDIFRAVGGLDAAELPVAYNDVDFCLKLRAAGLHNLWTPFATLIHRESATRGPDTDAAGVARLRHAAAIMRARWGRALAEDACYNTNFSLDVPYALGRAASSPASPPA